MAEIWHPWDTLMKLLMRKGAQALASLALPGVQVGDALDKELKVTNIEGDFFLDAHLGDVDVIVHFEFQKSQDEKYGSTDVEIQREYGYRHGQTRRIRSWSI